MGNEGTEGALAAMTIDEVANEYGRAFTDPQHAMYLYRGTKKFEQWADALYHRIAIAQA